MEQKEKENPGITFCELPCLITNGDIWDAGQACLDL